MVPLLTLLTYTSLHVTMFPVDVCYVMCWRAQKEPKERNHKDQDMIILSVGSDLILGKQAFEVNIWLE